LVTVLINKSLSSFGLLIYNGSLCSSGLLACYGSLLNLGLLAVVGLPHDTNIYNDSQEMK